MSRLRFPTKIEGETVDSGSTRGLGGRNSLRPVRADESKEFRGSHRIKGVKSLTHDHEAEDTRQKERNKFWFKKLGIDTILTVVSVAGSGALVSKIQANKEYGEFGNDKVVPIIAAATFGPPALTTLYYSRKGEINLKDPEDILSIFIGGLISTVTAGFTLATIDKLT